MCWGGVHEAQKPRPGRGQAPGHLLPLCRVSIGQPHCRLTSPGLRVSGWAATRGAVSRRRGAGCRYGSSRSITQGSGEHPHPCPAHQRAAETPKAKSVPCTVGIGTEPTPGTGCQHPTGSADPRAHPPATAVSGVSTQRPASRGLKAIGFRRCPANPPPSVSGPTTGLPV